VTKCLMLLCLLLVGRSALAQSGGTVTYVYTDPQGTPLAETDANGNITATFDYTPYGSKALGTPPNGPGYTGHVNDPETNLVYMQARYYDPVTGHFLSIDPIPVDAGDATNFGRYTYVQNNPITGVDTNGKFAQHLTGDQISCEVYQHSGCGTSSSGGGSAAGNIASTAQGSSSTSQQAGSGSGITTINQFDIGNDAHSTIQAIALASSPYYFAEQYSDPAGVLFFGRPDLGNIDTKSLWEVKREGSEMNALNQVLGYCVMTGFQYSPGNLPGFFGGSPNLTAQGMFATYTYHFSMGGVISYSYALKKNYQYRYNFFPRVNTHAVGAQAIMDVLKGIMTSPEALPVPVP
jgi:RHS repeat-associated protein